MSKKVAVILAGCGFLDGAEIRESVLTLLALDQRDAKYQCFAPNIEQHHVVNHLQGEPTQEKRNVLIESARIARGDIRPIDELNPSEFDAFIFPGGFGVAKNMSNFAFQGAQATVEPQTKKVFEALLSLGRPIGLICIAPAVFSLLMKDRLVTVTIGSDDSTAQAIVTLGGNHQKCATNMAIVDREHKVVSTPAYMDGDARISEVAKGIDQCIEIVLELA
jgi:enhancing lycopene biosynthesis protein 2